jgi:membrane protein DedA with SNARE-associated domain
MDARQILQFLDEQGMAVVFAVVFLEYLNLPGFPAGIILPATGFWVAYAGQSFLLAFGLSVLAGLLGSIVLYAIGYIGEDLLLVKLKAKRPALGARLDRFERRLHDNAFWAVLAGKLIPVLRTLICFPAGAAKVEMKTYLLASAAGVALWNGALMAAGYFLGGQVLGI